MSVFKCFGCKNDFSRPAAQARRYKLHFCSNDCRLQHNSVTTTKKLVACTACGREFLRYRSHINGKRCFCNRSCRRKYWSAKNKKRRCCACHRTKLIKHFSSSGRNNGSGQLQSWSYQCRKCASEKRKIYARSTPGRFKTAKFSAKQRGLAWVIPRLTFFDLVGRSCHYCNELTGAVGIGLDRKDNAIGYTIENVVPCCGKCNRFRSNILTFEEMEIFGRQLIAEVKRYRRVERWN